METTQPISHPSTRTCSICKKDLHMKTAYLSPMMYFQAKPTLYCSKTCINIDEINKTLEGNSNLITRFRGI